MNGTFSVRYQFKFAVRDSDWQKEARAALIITSVKIPVAVSDVITHFFSHDSVLPRTEI